MRFTGFNSLPGIGQILRKERLPFSMSFVIGIYYALNLPSTDKGMQLKTDIMKSDYAIIPVSLYILPFDLFAEFFSLHENYNTNVRHCQYIIC